MDQVKFWDRDKFPVVYEGGEMKAVVVDIASFEQIDMVLDNLLNREAESEDSILENSALLKRILAHARQQSPSVDWERELDEL